LISSGRGGHGVIAVVWQFQVKAGHQDAFEKFYGADGEWTDLGRKSRSFLGASFLRDQVNDTHYLLIEYWSEMVVYEKHRTSFVADLKSLEERRDEFCESIIPLGIYSALDIPDRFGPTWSRRDGV
jgi:quinol monooxygenase YgiN